MAETVWDRRLMSPARAIELGGHWPLRAVLVDDGTHVGIVVRCGWCRGRICALTARTTPAELLAAVLRHGVESHDLSLSGAPSEEDVRGRGRGAPDDQGARDPGGDPGGDEPGADAVRRDAEAPAGRRAARSA